MTEDDSAPSAWAALGPLMDLATPMALRVAATLRIADLMGDGPVAVESLAERSGTDVDALSRLLRHLATRGVFAEPDPGRFAAGGLGRLLHSDHPAGMRTWLDLDGFGGRMDLAFTELLHTVRTGEPAWPRVFGQPFWDHLAADRHLAASFDTAMATGPEYIVDAAGGCDWTAVSHVVDVGGGKGALLAEALRANPQLRATLVDLPDTVERGRAHLAALGLDDRCAFVGQSFFDPLPTGGDVYVLSGVVHDWPDDDAVAILRRRPRPRGRDARHRRRRPGHLHRDGPPDAGPLRRPRTDRGRLHHPGHHRRLRVADVHTTPLGHVLLNCVAATP
ncbi:MAG: methyltransferase [Streptosporangiales bacterium]|nr:methyltransferase [Streptosporangiales bacterium]